MKILNIFLIGFIVVLLVSCARSVEITAQKETLFTVTPTFTKKPTATSNLFITKTTTPTPNPFTPTVTLNPTQQIWLSTYTVIRETQRALDKQTREKTGKEIDQFPKGCEDRYDFDISPDSKWLATSCGDKTYSILVVQNKEGIKWVLDYKEFLHPSFSVSEGITGGLGVVSWDPSGEFLFFTASVGWSGGGDFCFPNIGGTLGLFRLDLKKGSWTTLIERTNRFPGDKIRFSPTGRRYAVDIDGITITDLQTGETVQINASPVMNLIWSPDGTKLAYSTSRCNEEGFVIESSLYIWDALENTSRLIINTEKIILTPISWNDVALLEISGEEFVDNNTIITVYGYDITKDEVVFVGPYSIVPY